MNLGAKGSSHPRLGLQVLPPQKDARKEDESQLINSTGDNYSLPQQLHGTNLGAKGSSHPRLGLQVLPPWNEEKKEDSDASSDFALGISKEFNSTSDSERNLLTTMEHSTSTGANADGHPRLGLQVPLCNKAKDEKSCTPSEFALGAGTSVHGLNLGTVADSHPRLAPLVLPPWTQHNEESPSIVLGTNIGTKSWQPPAASSAGTAALDRRCIPRTCHASGIIEL
jgi:hypothetical protein